MAIKPPSTVIAAPIQLDSGACLPRLMQSIKPPIVNLSRRAAIVSQMTHNARRPSMPMIVFLSWLLHMSNISIKTKQEHYSSCTR